MNLKTIAFALSGLFVSLSVQAVTISVNAATTNAFGDSLGNDLAAGSLVQIGSWDGASFSAVADFAIGDGTGGTPGSLFTSATSINTTGLGVAGTQVAYRWFDTTDNSGDFGIAYLDKAENTQWEWVAGDGSGTDSGSQAVDIGDLTDGTGTSFVTGATLITGSFGGSSTTFGGTPMFQVVPEPSTYAAILGLLALGAVWFKRRK